MRRGRAGAGPGRTAGSCAGQRGRASPGGRAGGTPVLEDAIWREQEATSSTRRSAISRARTWLGDTGPAAAALFLSAVSIGSRRPDGQLSPRSINLICEQIGRWHDAEHADAARNISPLRPHDLRHSFAFALAEATGSDAYELAPWPTTTTTTTTGTARTSTEDRRWAGRNAPQCPVGYEWRVEHLYWDLGSCAGGALFEVGLRGSTARVCLMDVEEYQGYLDGDEYEFHGGFFDVSPVVLQVPYDYQWYLVVDSYPARIKVEVSQIFD